MKKNSPLYTILFMVIITLICGSAIAFVQSSMKQTLTANATLVRNRTIAAAFGLTISDSTAEGYNKALSKYLISDTLRDDGTSIELFTTTSSPTTIGFIFKGMGFWDNITGIMVLTEDLSQINALRIIEQKETPGLGARITEDAFMQQFKQYPLQWESPQQKPFSYGATSGHNGKSVDALTGATQTSLALERMINSELIRFKAMYLKHKEGATGLALAGGDSWHQ